MKRRTSKGLLIVVSAMLLAGLYLLARSTQNSATFDRLHVWLLLFNAAAAVVLLVLIVTHLVRLIIQYRRRTPGSRLTARLVVMFVVLATLPVALVYYFSVTFLDRGIDSWFDVRVEQALDDALALSRGVLDVRVKELLARTERMANEIRGANNINLAVRIDALRQQSGASELTLFGPNSRIIATSASRPTDIVPSQPTDEIMLQLRRGRPYVNLDPIGGLGLHVRAVVPVSNFLPGAPRRYLQALYPATDRQGNLAQSVQAAYTRYRELTYLRKPLKYSLILTLSLVLLLGLLAAVWGAFYAARRLVAPIQDLAEGTRAVARGDFTRRLAVPARDEVGFLVSSFNEMTSRLGEAREVARRSQQQVESERAYLEAVLARLSSGVMALDSDLRLRTANSAASEILGLELDHYLGKPLADAAEQPFIAQFLELFKRHRQGGGTRHWREEIVVAGGGGRRILTCSCTSLPDVRDNAAGHVIVFDDLTKLIQAQRDAAWGEVARRLAHEIKNPLTPIRLAAERLRLRYLGTLSGKDEEIFDRATQTIVQQVETMKAMVNAFSEYARTPKLALQPTDLNRLITAVADLYRGTGGFDVMLDLDPTLPAMNVDSGRIGQMLHNLIRNAHEALEGRESGSVTITTRRLRRAASESAEIVVADDGPGLDAALLEHVFEPYVTSKPKGTGLGLAIVKKLVEEHGGSIRAENRPEGGALIRVHLPINERAIARSLLRVARRHDSTAKWEDA